jgi:dephospho-CoA kinase
MIIGITGGIGSGKSYICNLIKNKYNLFYLNTDIIIQNEIMFYDEVVKNIVNKFGEDSYIDNKINKVKFNNILYNDKNLYQINDIIINPLINYIKKLNETHSNLLVESSIILNTELYDIIDVKILVKSNIDDRIKRLLIRYNNDINLVFSKIKSQSFNEKLVTFVLINDDKINEGIEKIIEKINI